jgi:predicted enzyme related to lactoylglutathione lyase
MSAVQPHFGWYELMTTDTAAAGKFYSSVIGWNTKEMGAPGMPYTVFNTGDYGVAGMLTIPAEAAAMGTGPSWIGYIVVDDTDAYVARITAAGGKLCKEPTDVPGMLRFAVVTDPQGAAFVVFHSFPGMTPPANPPKPPDPGTVGWNELYAGDLETAWGFYSKLFGWTIVNDMDMGQMGVYRLFSDGDAAKTMGAGGMMTKPPNIPAPFWGFYFNVDSVNAAIERIKSGGGAVLNGPMQVPGGSWVAQAQDPQGGMFSVVSPNA